MEENEEVKPKVKKRRKRRKRIDGKELPKLKRKRPHKRGPKKKRGPKPKKKLPKVYKDRANKFQIYLIANNNKKAFIRTYIDKQTAITDFYQMVEKNKNEVIFPMRYVNTKAIKEVKYELILIKRKDENDTNVVKLRNEYGEFVEHELNGAKDWVLYEKAPYEIEETFWVFGYHPRYERKTFTFIFDEIVTPKATDKYEYVRVVILKNKLLFETATKLDMVICKNNDDCIRLYNMLEKKCEEAKYKYIMFEGDCDISRANKRYWVDKILEMTGWENNKSGRLKVLRPTTRP